MSASVYTRAQLGAAKTLRAKGQLCKLFVGGLAGTPVTVAAAIFDYPLHLVNGTSILSGDKQVIMEARALSADPVPMVDYLKDVNNVTYSIVTSQPLAPAGTPVIYTLQVRAGG